MNAPFPKALFSHPALTPVERASLSELDPEEFAKSAYTGLLALVEGVIAERTPGFHCQHTPARSSAAAEGAALARHYLHENLGFSVEQIEKGRAWLTHPGPKLELILKFFFRLRNDVRAYQKAQIVARFGLTPTN